MKTHVENIKIISVKDKKDTLRISDEVSIDFQFQNSTIFRMYAIFVRLPTTPRVFEFSFDIQARINANFSYYFLMVGRTKSVIVADAKMSDESVCLLVFVN